MSQEFKAFEILVYFQNYCSKGLVQGAGRGVINRVVVFTLQSGQL